MNFYSLFNALFYNFADWDGVIYRILVNLICWLKEFAGYLLKGIFEVKRGGFLERYESFFETLFEINFKEPRIEGVFHILPCLPHTLLPEFSR